MNGLEILDADAVRRLLRPRDAVRAVEDALRGGLDPAAGPARTSLVVGHGELLLMPAASAEAVGVKLVGVAPGNRDAGLPRVQGVYVLFDGATLTPRLVVDGAALTAVRTPAVSIAAVRARLEKRQGPLRAVVFGAGPQGRGHLLTLADVLRGAQAAGDDVVLEATVVVRSPARAALPPIPDVRAVVVGPDEPSLRAALRGADVVICATTSQRPLFAASDVSDRCVVVAVGAHDPDSWEVPPDLATRSQVVVEDPVTALREAGVVRAAVQAGHIHGGELVALRDLVRGDASPVGDRPLLFVSVGMAWEDLAVAEHLERARRHAGRAKELEEKKS